MIIVPGDKSIIHNLSIDVLEEALLNSFIDMRKGDMIVPILYQAIQICPNYRGGCKCELFECDFVEKRKCNTHMMCSTFYECLKVSMGTLPKEHLIKYAEEDYTNGKKESREEISKEEFEKISAETLKAIYEEIERRNTTETARKKTETKEEIKQPIIDEENKIKSEKTEDKQELKQPAYEEKKENENIETDKEEQLPAQQETKIEQQPIREENEENTEADKKETPAEKLEEKMKKAYLKFADAFFGKGDYSKALENYSKFLEKNKDDEYALGRKAKCEEELNINRKEEPKANGIQKKERPIFHSSENNKEFFIQYKV